LNDVFGFKPNEIIISKVGKGPDKPQDDERERERERDENGPNDPGNHKPTQQ
jgi:hypothetical protein